MGFKSKEIMEAINGINPPINMFRDECEGVSFEDFKKATESLTEEFGNLSFGKLVVFGTSEGTDEDLFSDLWEQ